MNVTSFTLDSIDHILRLPNRQDFLYMLTTEVADRFGAAPLVELGLAALARKSSPTLRDRTVDDLRRIVVVLRVSKRVPGSAPPRDFDVGHATVCSSRALVIGISEYPPGIPALGGRSQ